MRFTKSLLSAACFCVAFFIASVSAQVATKITSPQDGAVFEEGEKVTLTGEGESLEWSYDANSDGKGEESIGSGASVEFTIPGGVSGPRTIVIFLRGANGNDQISGTIGGGTATGLNIDCSNYRIALSHDGNANDLDDIVAAPLALAIVVEAGLKDKFVFMDYSNHICGDGPNQAEAMRVSVSGACEKWGVDPAKTFEVRVPSVLTEAKAAFKKAAIDAYNDGARLYYACGGPMEVPYQMVSQLDQKYRDNITVISHSTWNDNHSMCGHTWSDLTPLCESMHITDQNSPCWNDGTGDWQWLADKGGKYEWLYNRNQKQSWDGSDAGMAFYIITGRGNQNAEMADAKALFNTEHSCAAVASDRPQSGNPAIRENHSAALQNREARAFSLDGRFLGTVRISGASLRIVRSSLPGSARGLSLRTVVIQFDSGQIRKLPVLGR
jgi:hypothetical protein